MFLGVHLWLNMHNHYPTDSAAWLDYFTDNLNHEKDLPWHCGVYVQEPLRGALIRTLQRFHLGESGEGKWLKAWAADLQDGDYGLAIEFFVSEEQAHSRWFGRLLDEIGAPKLENHWSDALFTKIRRVGGLHFELVTFLTAEIIGKRLFQQLSHRCDDELTSAVFSRVVKDESAHIAFHVATLRAAFGRQNWLQRKFWRLSWRFLMLGALLLMCLDHAPLFRALNLSRRDFCLGCWKSFARVSGKIWRGRASASSKTGALIWD